MNILNIEHVSKIYGDKVIFDDVSFGIHHGDKIGIIGINGTGKTTLLRIIAGIEETDEGYAFVYDVQYLNNENAKPISLTMPLTEEKYFSEYLLSCPFSFQIFVLSL